jgi:hypothetical protein
VSSIVRCQKRVLTWCSRRGGLHEQLSGFENPDAPHYTFKLDKASYGLKQATVAWFSRLSTKLQDLGFASSKAESSLFLHKKERYHYIFHDLS